MNYTYIYILAPDAGNNAQVLHDFCLQYADLVEERRVGIAYAKNSNDVLDSKGSLLVPAGAKFYYVKATASEFTQSMLDNVTDPQTFNKDNQPFSDYWLNIK